MERVLLDAAGHRRSPATMPGYHRGRPPRNKGEQYPADPPTIEEIVEVMRTIGERSDGLRLRALIVLLWRTGLRIRSSAPSTDGHHRRSPPPPDSRSDGRAPRQRVGRGVTTDPPAYPRWRRAGRSPLWLLSPPFRTGRASLAGCRCWIVGRAAASPIVPPGRRSGSVVGTP
jgi:hypothetical protein